MSKIPRLVLGPKLVDQARAPSLKVGLRYFILIIKSENIDKNLN